METLSVDAPSAALRGEAQGVAWRREIRELVHLARDHESAGARFAKALEDWAPELHDELRGMANAADLSVESLACVDAWTARMAAGGRRSDEGTSLYVDGPAGPLLACTWDLDAERAPFVRALHVRGELDAMVLTLPGSLGRAGLSAGGTAAVVMCMPAPGHHEGIAGSALLRAALSSRDLDRAYERLRSAHVASATYLAMSDGRRFDGIEFGEEVFIRVQSGARTAHPHTDHCFDPVLRKVEITPPDSTSFRRMELTTTAYAQERPANADEVWRFLGSHVGYPSALCAHGREGAPSTAAAWCMHLVGGAVWMASGCVHEREPARWSFEHWRGAATRDELLENNRS